MRVGRSVWRELVPRQKLPPTSTSDLRHGWCASPMHTRALHTSEQPTVYFIAFTHESIVICFFLLSNSSFQAYQIILVFNNGGISFPRRGPLLLSTVCRTWSQQRLWGNCIVSKDGLAFLTVLVFLVFLTRTVLVSSSNSVEEFEEVVNERYDESALKEGYAPFCKHLFLVNDFTDAQVNVLPITPENEACLRTKYEARNDKEVMHVMIWHRFAREWTNQYNTTHSLHTNIYCSFQYWHAFFLEN